MRDQTPVHVDTPIPKRTAKGAAAAAKRAKPVPMPSLAEAAVGRVFACKSVGSSG